MIGKTGFGFLSRKITKKIVPALILLFVFMNILAIFHAYRFTHFEKPGPEKTQKAQELSATEKIKALLFGVNNPKPVNVRLPSQLFTTFTLSSNKKIECWFIKVQNAKGTILLFHGYGGNKSSMLDKSDLFLKSGYNTFLVDFMGSGGSEGNQTTIGFKEAEQVETAYNFVKNSGETNIYLFGTSMGAVAVMKAVSDYKLKPNGLMLECPFGSMYKTVCTRFRAMHIPSFPMAGLLVFWGGLQNGYWAFSHNPVAYAKNIECPVLLMYGQKDKNVSKEEIDEIFEQLSGEKQLKLYEFAGHENYLNKYREQWIMDIQEFLKRYSEKSPK